MRKLLLLITFLYGVSCIGQTCETLPNTFSSYTEALTKITKASFNFSDNVDTSRSSWIEGANYYQCDDSVSFLIIKTKSNSYIHKNVPQSTWYAFKEATSFGKFYNKHLKGRFQLAI